jgi:valyl-tRNA synthetase
MSRVYPMALRPQAHDIISFWLFTTVVKCYLHTKKLPWKDVMISGYGLDAKGMPMHKSAGNIIEPKVVIERYGVDALRHWASVSRLGDDASFQEKDVMTGSKMVNKLWNVARFVDMNRDAGADSAETTNPMDEWITSRLLLTVKSATEMFDEYNYAGAKRQIDEFFWFFCDNYLEFIKYRTYGNDRSASRTLNRVFLSVIKMLAPFMPYITEEIYQELYGKSDGARSVHLSEWPEADPRGIDKNALAKGDEAWRIITFIRQWKHENKMALNAELREVVVSKDMGALAKDIGGAMNIKNIRTGTGSLRVPETDVSIEIKG